MEDDIVNAATNRSRRRRMLAAIFLAAAMAVPWAAPLVARGGQTAGAPASAVQEFQRRLGDYLTLRAELSKTLKPLSPTASATDLAARQQALAEALRAARASARPGDLVPAAVAEQIRSVVIADFNRRTAAEERATFSEVPDAPIPTINRPYPADAALPTVPPLLLMALPRMPDSLQYRFYGRHIVLLDGDVQIIVDYIANVLPAH